MVPIDTFGLTEESSKLIKDLQNKGYETALEFKPKVDWPKEDEGPKDARYVFGCTAAPGITSEWVVEVSECPDVAIKKVARRVAIR